MTIERPMFPPRRTTKNSDLARFSSWSPEAIRDRILWLGNERKLPNAEIERVLGADLECPDDVLLQFMEKFDISASWLLLGNISGLRLMHWPSPMWGYLPFSCSQLERLKNTFYSKAFSNAAQLEGLENRSECEQSSTRPLTEQVETDSAEESVSKTPNRLSGVFPGGVLTEWPEAAAGALYRRTDISPENLFQALGRLRKQAQDEIERLLAFLDELEGVADLEPCGDEEPELGSVSGKRGFHQDGWAAGLDAEASLAAPERHPEGDRDAYGWSLWDTVRRDSDGSQLAWTDGAADDREGEHDGREPNVDDELSGDEDEPSLGSFDRLANQDHAWQSRSWPWGQSDHEADPAN